jgi:hypothetical protein
MKKYCEREVYFVKHAPKHLLFTAPSIIETTSDRMKKPHTEIEYLGR